ncbi:hypothetical protein D9M69_520260 [compost metagenome]
MGSRRSRPALVLLGDEVAVRDLPMSASTSLASRTVTTPGLPLPLWPPLTTTKGFSLMPYSLYLRRTLVSTASTWLVSTSMPRPSATSTPSARA